MNKRQAKLRAWRDAAAWIEGLLNSGYPYVGQGKMNDGSVPKLCTSVVSIFRHDRPLGTIMSKTTTYYARSLVPPDQKEVVYQELTDHLHNVATGTAARIAVFAPEWESWAYILGWLHDLGKTRPAFQYKLINNSKDLVDHTSTGAAWLSNRYKNLTQKRFQISLGKLLASVAVGHHGGLRNYTTMDDVVGKTTAGERIRKGTELLSEVDPTILPELDLVITRRPSILGDTPNPRNDVKLAHEVVTRLLFSALVDTDGEDAAQFERPGKRDWILQQANLPSIKDLRRRLDAFIRNLKRTTKRTKLNRLRRKVYNDCCKASTMAQGVFSLTAPTGLGKTFAMVAFALRHAEIHNLRRVIIVMPYTTIIEQNADVLKKVFGDNIVLEHHSAFAEDGSTDSRGTWFRRSLNQALRTNWDAPIIVTTNVQFYESLFTNKVMRSRKLHNVPRSVIVFDEAQSVEPTLLEPTLDMLRRLQEHYGCSLVFSTATQPILGRSTVLPFGFPKMQEIILDPDQLFSAVKNRVKYDWGMAKRDFPTRQDVVSRGIWKYMADKALAHRQVLLVTHKRDDALALYKAIRDQAPDDQRTAVYHMSARMCPQHRKVVLREVKRCLGTGASVYLVSTQLIEAGVDIDFPIVFRAFGGADSLAQAAGRCNRNGNGRKPGRVFFFRAPTDPPPGLPTKALRAMDQVVALLNWEVDLSDQQLFARYFNILYDKIPSMDGTVGDDGGIQENRIKFNFQTVGRKYHIIKDGFMRAVVVPFGEGERLVQTLEETGEVPKEFWGKLSLYIVNLYPNDFKAIEAFIRQAPGDGLFYLPVENSVVYHEVAGLIKPEQSFKLLSGE